MIDNSTKNSLLFLRSIFGYPRTLLTRKKLIID